TVGARIISPASVQIFENESRSVSAPDDHFTAGPDCSVAPSGIGRIGGAGACPTVGARIIFSASVKSASVVKSAPDDHFTASPDCGVAASRCGHAGGAGHSPRVVRAGNRRTRVIRWGR